MRLPFLERVRQRVVVLDGAMGSNLQLRTFDLKRDWMGQENISEVLNFTRPEVIQEIHEEFWPSAAMRSRRIRPAPTRS